MTPVCYVVAAADGFSVFEKQPGDLVIAADGGCRHLTAAGMVPDLIVGDLDSAQSLPTDVPLLRHPVRKDDTDTALALQVGLSRGYRSFVIFGALGGREDHTFANYCLLLYLKQQGADGVIRSQGTDIRVLCDETITLKGQAGDGLSVFAFGAEARSVTLRGVSYPLTDARLTTAVPLGISNEFVTDTAQISVKEGALLCFHRHVEFDREPMGGAGMSVG